MERQRLLHSTQKYRQALEGQVDDLKDNAIKIAMQGLVFGGVALGSYFLVRAFQRRPKREKSETGVVKTSFMSTIFSSIQAYIVSFLLSMAREKITSYLENYFAKNNAHSGAAQESAAG